jgi:ADP-L-glycero-D-manno-heptose 6-epimerase
MLPNDVIAITGAAGFIGSYLTGYLNNLGYHQLILVDDFSRTDKESNLSGKKFIQKIERSEFIDAAPRLNIKYIFHLGARTDTTEMNYGIHKTLNLDYSKAIWELCTQSNIPLVYASSAATYGNGEHGYTDSHDIIDKLQPLNPYGRSKNEFDIWALAQNSAPPFWAGMKFFNVYGPNEYHKSRMASVIFHAYKQIKETGSVKLFRSHNAKYKDGEQLRDFIYVDDVASISTWLMQQQPANGLYNVGTGQARTFKDLVTAIFNTLQLPVNIEYVDTPEDIRDKYQYFTEANMGKLRNAGYNKSFLTLEEGVAEYLGKFLDQSRNF